MKNAKIIRLNIAIIKPIIIELINNEINISILDIGASSQSSSEPICFILTRVTEGLL